MKNSINKKTSVLTSKIITRLHSFYTKIKKIKMYYQKLNRKQRILLFFCFSILIFAFIVFTVCGHLSAAKESKESASLPVKFQSAPKPTDQSIINISPIHKEEKIHKSSISSPIPSFDLSQFKQFKHRLDQITDHSNRQYNLLKKQLESIKSHISVLASQSDLQQLQDAVSKPNPSLLKKVAGLQDSIQKIIQQTNKAKYINPKTIEKYFQLAAVQGFSDGMRAIIDIDGNQTTLSINEVCPACRGWTLKSLDFPHQSAVFEKTEAGQKQYVKLQAN